MRKLEMASRTLELPDHARVQIFLEFYRIVYSIEHALLHLAYRFDVEGNKVDLQNLDRDDDATDYAPQ